VNADGFHLSEQIDRNSGKQMSASDLTWSYAEVLNAMDKRATFMKKVAQKSRSHGISLVNGRNPYRMPLGSTCTGPHEFCCEAPGGDPNNCPSSARTSDCDAQGACCCA